LPVFLERRRDACDGAPLWVDVKAAVQDSLGPEGLDLKCLEDRVCMDPQITAVLIAAANSAGHHGTPVQTLSAALHKLQAGQSMNLILGLALKHNVVLGDPGLVGVMPSVTGSCPRTPPTTPAVWRACWSWTTSAVTARASCIGSATWRCCAAWKTGARVAGRWMTQRLASPLHALGAAYGSALRTRWRLPLELRQLIAAIYSLEGGVYSREALVMNLAAQMARLTEHEGLEALARSKTARLLKVGLSELMRLRKA
jgi:HD-like signal output (HDOD) protein